MTFITRRYRFSASHRLHSPELSAVENANVYGKCNNPFGHGHDYVLEVTVSGEVNPETGLIVPIGDLDRFVGEKVLELFSSRNINLDVPQFSTSVPTTENIVLVISELLQQAWTGYLGHTGARLRRINLQETERNGFEVLLGTYNSPEVIEQRIESVMVNA